MGSLGMRLPLSTDWLIQSESAQVSTGREQGLWHDSEMWVCPTNKLYYVATRSTVSTCDHYKHGFHFGSMGSLERSYPPFGNLKLYQTC